MGVAWLWRASLVISNKCAPFETILHILMGFVGYSTVWFRSVQSFLVYHSPLRMMVKLFHLVIILWVLFGMGQTVLYQNYLLHIHHFKWHSIVVHAGHPCPTHPLIWHRPSVHVPYQHPCVFPMTGPLGVKAEAENWRVADEVR